MLLKITQKHLWMIFGEEKADLHFALDALSPLQRLAECPMAKSPDHILCLKLVDQLSRVLSEGGFAADTMC